MNKLGLLYLNGDKKTDKNNSKSTTKTKNVFNEMFGKIMAKNSKNLNFSKVMEESDLKTKNSTDFKLINEKTGSENKKNKINLSFSENENKKIKKEEIELNIALNTNLTADNNIIGKENNKNEVKLNMKKSDLIKEKKAEPKEENDKNVKKSNEKESSSNGLELNLSNAAVIITHLNESVKEKTEKSNYEIEEIKNRRVETEAVELKTGKSKTDKSEDMPKESIFKSVLEKDENKNEFIELKAELKNEIKISERKTDEKFIENINFKKIEDRFETDIFNEKLSENKIEIKSNLTESKENEKIQNNFEKEIKNENRENSIDEGIKTYVKNSNVVLNEKIDLRENITENQVKTEKDSILKTFNIEVKQNIQEIKESLKIEKPVVRDEIYEKIKIVSADSGNVKNKDEKIEIISKNENNSKEKIVLKDSLKVIKTDEGIKNSEISEIKTDYSMEKIEEIKETEKNIEGLTALERKSQEDETSETKLFTTKDSKNFEKEEILNQSFISSVENKIEIRNIEKQHVVYSKKEIENSYTQVENMIKMNFNSDTKEMRLRLSPEDLGEVEVKISIEKNIMQAEFLVENEKVKEMLESRFTDLKNALLDKGITTSDINVNISGGSSQDRGYAQKSFYEGLMENRGIRKIKTDEKEYVAAVEKNSAGYNRGINGSLDIRY